MKNEFVNQHPNTIGMTIYDVFKMILGSKTNKYLPLIVKEIHKKSEEFFNDKYTNDELFNIAKNVGLDSSYLTEIPTKHRYVLYALLRLLEDNLLNPKTILLFDELCENKYITNVDFTSLSSFNELQSLIDLGTTKRILKEERKMVDVVVETDEWFGVRPLTFESSKKYGAGTKWCTTSENYENHFYRYSRDGVLVYLFNKINGNKYGIHFTKSEHESPLSIYDSMDKRVDSSIARIPFDVMDIITEKIGFNNEKLESSQDYIKRVYPEIFTQYWESYYNKNKDTLVREEEFTEDILVEEYDVQTHDDVVHTFNLVNDSIPLSTGSLVDSDHLQVMVNTLRENLKPKNILHKWYRNIFFGGNKKIVFLGIPVSSIGEFGSIQERLGNEFEGYKNLKFICYPVYSSKDLIITEF